MLRWGFLPLVTLVAGAACTSFGAGPAPATPDNDAGVPSGTTPDGEAPIVDEAGPLADADLDSAPDVVIPPDKSCPDPTDIFCDDFEGTGAMGWKSTWTVPNGSAGLATGASPMGGTGQALHVTGMDMDASIPNQPKLDFVLPTNPIQSGSNATIVMTFQVLIDPATVNPFTRVGSLVLLGPSGVYDPTGVAVDVELPPPTPPGGTAMTTLTCDSTAFGCLSSGVAAGPGWQSVTITIAPHGGSAKWDRTVVVEGSTVLNTSKSYDANGNALGVYIGAFDWTGDGKVDLWIDNVEVKETF